MAEDNDGKRLEALVAFVEQKYLQPGFSVRTNQREYEGKVQVAEFDIEVTGDVGSTSLRWLISCRDRPSSGSAPAKWIRELVGVREEFKFNKVTAVSTTGFSEAAKTSAEKFGIELREVRALAPSDFDSWLQLEFIEVFLKRTELKFAQVLIHESTDATVKTALEAKLARANIKTKFLISSKDLSRAALADVFRAIADGNDLFAGLQPGDPPRTVKIEGRFVDDDHFEVETDEGLVRIERLRFEGELTVIKELVPIANAVEYRGVGTATPISQSVSFAEHQLGDDWYSFEIHRMPKSGETHLLLRRVNPKEDC